jgi:predicted DNA-binding antitoxin AbrB/MazE fold protein
MQKTIEVMYEKGVFKPLEPMELEIPEGTKVKFEIKDNSLTTKSLLINNIQNCPTQRKCTL